MHPNGQIPAYEFAFGDVNPPVHAWACWRVYKMTRPRGERDRAVPRARLPQAAAQLHLVGEPQGSRGQQPLRRRLPRARQHRRLRPLAAAADRRSPRAGRRHGVDGVLLRHHAVDGARAGQRGSRRTRTSRPSSSSTSSRIADAMNTLGGTGLWDDDDGFYYDQLHVDGQQHAAARALAGRAHPAVRRRDPRRSDVSSSCPASGSGWTGSSTTGRTSRGTSPA